MASSSKSRINRRLVNSKRHTVGYVLTGKQRVSRSKAISLARSGSISGVRVVGSGPTSYLQSTTDRRLYDLPETVDRDMKSTSRR